MRGPFGTFLAISMCAIAIAAQVHAVEAAKLPAAATHPVEFEKHIRPIFEAHCLKCHGPEKQKGGFRLDRKHAALHEGDNYAPNIRPGKSAESPLIHFVAGIDPEVKMPSKGDPLTAEQIGLLRAWIDQGAPWPEQTPPPPLHWSFRPLERPTVPGTTAVQPGKGALNPIDAFVLAKLHEKGLTHSPEADRRTLIRRVSFDLIGLPPTPEEIDAFVNDPEPNAYEKLVERLLASPHYGERWARHWLDVVRFAESDGFETNQPRPNAWPYRDYVIRAFNEEKPYDQFIREQIAGDTLGVDEATGFLVGGPVDMVKSPDPVLTAQQRADELHDIVSTTGSAFLGLTVNCSRCHNHKFDPIPQAEYFAMKAVFAGVQHGERPLRTREDEARKKQLAAMRAELNALEGELSALEVPVSLREDLPARRSPVSRGQNSERFNPIEARFLRFTVYKTTDAEPCIDELEVFTSEPEPRNVALATHGTKLASSGDYQGNPAHKLEHLNDGRYGNERSWISNERGRGWVQLEFPRTERIERILWSRDRSESPKYEDRLATSYDIEVSLDARQWQRVASGIDRLPRGSKVSEENDYSIPDDSTAARLKQVLARRKALTKEIASAAKGPVVYAGVFGKPEETRRHYRGDPMQPREEIAPGGLSALGGEWQLPLDAPEPERRATLARWIASPANPLTARVMANRLWHYHFGTGIVDTPSDFGKNGGQPSHPQLLDWLAAEFINAGWSVKHLHRLILLSGTYRQASAVRPDAMQVDAAARLLWRFPPHRLEAEPLRDSILAVSGRLDLRAGGPGFDLFEPNTNYVKVYTTKTKFSADEFRRMIYQSKPRVELDTLFGAFDCPDAGQIAPRRTSSTTPLQALNLLNSEFLVEQAAAFAERLRRDAGADVNAQVQRGFALAFGHPATPGEVEASKRLIADHGLSVFCRALYNANEFLTVY